MLSLLINSPGCACEFCCHSQIISECIHDGRYSPSVPSSLAASPQTPPGGCKNNSSQYTRRTPQPASSKTLLCFSSPALLRCFPWERAVSKAPANEFQTISGIEIYWQNSNKPVCLPARPCGSHCPERSEHMLLSSAACLTAKG